MFKMVAHFIIKYQKLVFVNITKSLIKKLLNIGNISTLNTSFPKFQFSFERLSIIFVVNLINCFSWSDGFTLLLYLLIRKYLPGNHVWITPICLSAGISDENVFIWKREHASTFLRNLYHISAGGCYALYKLPIYKKDC